MNRICCWTGFGGDLMKKVVSRMIMGMLIFSLICWLMDYADRFPVLNDICILGINCTDFTTLRYINKFLLYFRNFASTFICDHCLWPKLVYKTFVLSFKNEEKKKLACKKKNDHGFSYYVLHWNKEEWGKLEVLWRRLYINHLILDILSLR